MPTSNSTDYNRNTTQIINRALRNLGVLGQEESPNASEFQDSLEALNVMVKQWQVEGINLWKQEDLILWLVKGQSKYTLGTDHAATTWVRTTTTAAAVSTATAIDVTSVTGMTAADNIGIVLDDETIQWTTIASISTLTVNLDDALTDDVSSAAQVWTYTTKAVRPLRVDLPRRRDGSLQDVPIWPVTRQEYFDTPNKTVQARPVNVYYDPQLTGGEVHLWPSPESVDDTILLSAKMPIEDFDSIANDPDFPQEWLSGLSWGLAEEMALEYEIPMERHQRIAAKAASVRASLSSWDNEEGSVFIQPDFFA